MVFSFFEGGITVKVPSQTISLPELVEMIRGNTYQEPIFSLRNESDAVRKTVKKRLDYVCPAGTFSPHRHADNCTSRSGLIVMDFDDVENLEETKLQMAFDPYSCLIFTSPSGTGLKVIVKIETEKDHKDYFNDLSFYYQKEYNLVPDASGSDVSRACFLSWDRELVYHPDAQTWKYRGMKPPKKKAETNNLVSTISKRSTERDMLAHITLVVERVEAAALDITGDYSTEWLMLAFSLSTQGEAGRDLFHRVSRFNEKYDERDADEKFTNALRTCRFTSPGKFFSIAKDYGVDVSKAGMDGIDANVGRFITEHYKTASGEDIVRQPNPSELDNNTGSDENAAQEGGKKAKKERKSKVADPESFMEDEYPRVIYYPNVHKILVKTGKYYDTVAEDFLLFVKYKTEDENEEITWILELKTPQESIFVEVPHEDFCSARKLKNLVATKRLSLKITDSHLDELRSYLFRKTKFSSAVKVLRHGYHIPSGVYFFSNVAIVKGAPVEPDEFGIVPAGDEFLSIPQGGRTKQYRYHLTTNSVSFNQFFSRFSDAHRYENAFIPACFYIFSLFRDLALRYKNFSPILFLKGGAGTGKSSIVRVLTSAFGRKQEGVNLKNKNTESALVKLMGQSSNMVIWFDEFHNELGGTEGLLQAAYDNDGYHRSSDNTSIETNAVEIHSALALTSNYLPDNPIFFSRCLFIPITSQEKTDEQRKAFYQLEEWQEKGLGCLTVELLNHRAVLEANDNYATSYDRLYTALKARFQGENLPERLFGNMAQVMAAPLVLQEFGLIQMLEFEDGTPEEILDAFVEIGAQSIRRQHRINSEKSELAAFLEIIQTLYDAGALQEEIHFRFNGPDVSLWFPQLYNLYAPRYRQIYMKAPADRDTIQTELAAAVGKHEWSEIAKSIRFRNDGEGSSNAPTTPRRDCCSVPYELMKEKFGLDLQSRNTRI